MHRPEEIEEKSKLNERNMKTKQSGQGARRANPHASVESLTARISHRPRNKKQQPKQDLHSNKLESLLSQHEYRPTKLQTIGNDRESEEFDYDPKTVPIYRNSHGESSA